MMDAKDFLEIEDALRACCERLQKLLKCPVYFQPPSVEQKIEIIGYGRARLTTTINTRFFATDIAPFKDEEKKL